MLFMTLANKITSVRFLLCAVYFVLLEFCQQKSQGARDVRMMTLAFVLNQIIAWSDLLDGYVARKFKQITHFGRIADPLVDKILVCGSFIYFLKLDPLPHYFTAWFVVVVLGREFLVSGIRGAAEAAGIPFGATFWGKQKTFVQNTTVGWGLGFAAWTAHVRWTGIALEALVWITLVSTVVSGLTYVMDARKLLGSERI
jgi:CDP-diacylglycerol--glycerol-3-phosphate 3-phosphatidyltransferase